MKKSSTFLSGKIEVKWMVAGSKEGGFSESYTEVEAAGGYGLVSGSEAPHGTGTSSPCKCKDR